MLKISKDIYRNKAIPLLYALGLFGFPLASSIPVFLGVESRPISLSLRIAVLLLSLRVLLPIKKSLLSNRYFLLFIIFWLLYTLRILYTLVAEEQIVGFMSNLEFFAFAFGTCLIPSLAIFNGLQIKKWNADSIFKVTFYVLLITTIGGIYLLDYP
jgi:predicted CDP-diglyceride synthetase/phosphatidate cytidylyltransferase